MSSLLYGGMGSLMLRRELKRAMFGQRRRKCSFCGVRHAGGAGAHGTPAQREMAAAEMGDRRVSSIAFLVLGLLCYVALVVYSK